MNFGSKASCDPLNLLSPMDIALQAPAIESQACSRMSLAGILNACSEDATPTFDKHASCNIRPDCCTAFRVQHIHPPEKHRALVMPSMASMSTGWDLILISSLL